MNSKERLWALTKEGPIHEVKKDHESPKSQKEEKKKEIIIIIIIKKKEEDLGQRACSKDLGQAKRYAARRINIKALCMFRCMQKAIKNLAKTRYYLCNPWSKPVGSQVDSKGGMVWSVGE